MESEEVNQVMVVSIDENYQHSELDAKLLYVAMTLSLHQLLGLLASSASPALWPEG